MIKPDFWDDEKLATQTSRDARLVFIGLWNHSDDYGVVKGNVTWLKNHIFPYEDSLSIQAFSKWLSELEKGAWIIPFNGSGEKFYYIRNFSKHQAVNRPSAQRNPVPPDSILEYSLNPHGVLTSETETETETESTELKVGSTPPGDTPAFIKIPLNDNSEYSITEDQIKEFEKCYPGVDVRQELREIRAWNLSNPRKRKTNRGILNHINYWLGKEQNRGKGDAKQKDKIW